MNFSIILVLLITIGVFIVKYFWYNTLISLGFECPKRIDNFKRFDEMYERWGSLFFVAIFISALIEEVFFRFVPILLATRVYNGYPVISVVIIFSYQIFFGYIHGNMKNVIFQGIGGVIYVFLFILVGGLHNFFVGLFYIATIHTLSNLECKFGWIAKGLTKLGV